MNGPPDEAERFFDEPVAPGDEATDSGGGEGEVDPEHLIGYWRQAGEETVRLEGAVPAADQRFEERDLGEQAREAIAERSLSTPRSATLRARQRSGLHRWAAPAVFGCAVLAATLLVLGGGGGEPPPSPRIAEERRDREGEGGRSEGRPAQPRTSARARRRSERRSSDRVRPERDGAADNQRPERHQPPPEPAPPAPAPPPSPAPAPAQAPAPAGSESAPRAASPTDVRREFGQP